jgi:small conductance mechanosensitive channel
MHFWKALVFLLTPEPHAAIQILNDWREDAFDFLRNQAPRILAILIVAFVLARLLKVVSQHVSNLSTRQVLPSAVRTQQLRTLSSVIYSVGVFIIGFLATMQILTQLNIKVEPLLASAGIAGLAVGFGAQTLVKDFINGFFILVENQYDIGDTVRIAGVQGVVEGITLRRTVLRDGDGTVHTVPSSQITIVSNLTRDWAQLAMKVSVSYRADSDTVIQLLKEVATEVAHDPQFENQIVAEPEVPGIERVQGDEVEYLLLVKTRPGAQYAVSRELRRRIKSCFEKAGIEPGNPNRVYVVETGSTTGQPPPVSR